MRNLEVSEVDVAISDVGNQPPYEWSCHIPGNGLIFVVESTYSYHRDEVKG